MSYINNPVSTDATQTLTNKRITKRVVNITVNANPTWNTDNGDIFRLIGLNTNVASFTANLSGTPADGDIVQLQIKDDGTPRAIVFGASLIATTIPLPTITVASTLMRISFQYSSISTKLELVAVV